MTQKALHVLIHIIGWALLIIFPLIFFDNSQRETISIDRLFPLILVPLFFYLNYFLFIPKLLLNNRLLIYLGTVIISLVVAYGLNFYHSNFIIDQMNKEGFSQISPETKGRQNFGPPKMYPGQNGKPPNATDFRLSMQKRMSFTATSGILIAFLLSTIIRITQEWYKTEKQKKEIVNEKLISELSFLKSQVSPHFLFNTLNGIYSLALKKSNETPRAILKLSGLMRHMLYESERENVLLEKEIEYLENYVDLQKMRLSKESDVKFDVVGNIENKLIHPMLLIPFIENAFKHGQDRSGVRINILIELKGAELCMKVNNKISTSSVKDESSGIGLENVKKRLDLLYANSFSLKSRELNDVHFTKLTLKLKMI